MIASSAQRMQAQTTYDDERYGSHREIILRRAAAKKRGATIL